MKKIKDSDKIGSIVEFQAQKFIHEVNNESEVAEATQWLYELHSSLQVSPEEFVAFHRPQEGPGQREECSADKCIEKGHADCRVHQGGLPRGALPPLYTAVRIGMGIISKLVRVRPSILLVE